MMKRISFSWINSDAVKKKIIFLLRIVLLPLVPLYSASASIRNWFFDKKIFKTEKVPAKVISVGNLTLGGAGKTPAVIYITELLKSYEKKVGVLSRGYGRKSKGYLLVSNGTEILAPVDQCGDEIYYTVKECGVPAAVAENRVEGAKQLIKSTGADVLVLDDAYQHRWIDRDINLLIFEQRFLFSAHNFDRYLLPSGLMREKLKAVKRADAVIINRKFSAKETMPQFLKKYFGDTKIFTSHYKSIGFVDVMRNLHYGMEEFEGQKSLVVSGIAHPFSFINALKLTSVDTQNQMIFSDHKDYSLKEIQQIRKKFYATNSHSVVTTPKDAVKLAKFSAELDDIDIFYLKIELAMDDDEAFRSFIISKMNF